MDRKYVDCRDFPEAKCSVTLAADTEQELLDAAMDHGVRVHGFQDTPATREEIRRVVKTGCAC